MIRWIVTVLLLGATTAVVLLNPPENLAVGRAVLRRIPATFGPWSGEDFSFEDAVVEELKADDLLMRRYVRDGGTVWLCVVYHENRRYGAHDPTLCYDSQGYLVESPGRARVDDGTSGGIEANTFVATRKKERRVVWYWWATEGLATADTRAFRDRMAVMGALENRSWGSFVRVESVASEGDLDAARARVADFASRVSLVLPSVFAGVDSAKGGRP